MESLESGGQRGWKRGIEGYGVGERGKGRDERRYERVE